MNQKWLTWIIIVAVIILALVIMYFPKADADVELAKCIGSKSILYTHTGCGACEIQKDAFGESYKYLNVINGDTWEELAKYNISATPTWAINGQKYSGVQSLEELKKLTGC